MAIDFHQEKNRYTYAGRQADRGWAEAIKATVDARGKAVADIGCGGGIYSQAWHELGAREVTGIDFSGQMVLTAREKAAGLPGVSFRQGQAEATGLPGQGMDIVFERALIHHLKNYEACFAEAHRLLVAGGTVIIQDRTPEDVGIPGSGEHIRGYFFERFPRLLEIEAARRPRGAAVEHALRGAGFGPVATRTLWEVRKTYASFDQLADDLAARSGRSILHELTDAELQDLIACIGSKEAGRGPVVEQDRWTLWSAVKPA